MGKRNTLLFILIAGITLLSYQNKPKLEKEWASFLKYEGVVLEDDEYHIWGSSPIWGDDGKVHVFASRIPVESGFGLWYATSQIAHYVSDNPEGPFKFVEVLLKPEQSAPGSWDTGAQHNPTVTKIDGLYVLTYHSNTSTKTDRAARSHKIGMMTAKSVNGPWEKLGMILEPPADNDTTIWCHKHMGGIDNPSLIKHPNGKYYLYYRAKWKGLEGGNTYGVAISDKLEGPYIHCPKRVINNTRYIEDPYVFVYHDTIFMLLTDNYKGNGMLLTSTDGLHFEFIDAELGFDKMEAYIPADKLNAAPNYRGPKFERPQLLMKDGIPTHLFAPAGVNINGGKGTCCYLFKIDMSN